MKVFFTASQKGQDQFGTFYQEIFKKIKSEGYDHVDDELFTVDSAKFYEKMEKEGFKSHFWLYQKNLKSLRTADINIFDSSFPSLSIGYMIMKSIELNKPTVVFYYKDHIPYFLNGTDEEKLITQSYSEDTLDQVVEQTLEVAKQRTDKRFNFFVSSNLLSYIEQTSKEEGVTKSTFVRNLILTHKRNKQQVNTI